MPPVSLRHPPKTQRHAKEEYEERNDLMGVGGHASGPEQERGDDHFVLSRADDYVVLARWKIREGELTQFICRRQSDLPCFAQELDAERMGGSVPHREYLASNHEVFIGQDRLDG